jgi:hypothetical protein
MAEGEPPPEVECPLRPDRGQARARPIERSSLKDDPGAKFSVENCGFPQRKKKKQKERNKGPWKLTSLMEIRKERGFPQRLEALRLHSSPRPDGGDKLKTGTFYFAKNRNFLLCLDRAQIAHC